MREINRLIYLDNASTTPLCHEAKRVIYENIEEYYNPNSVYEPARKIRVKVEEAREKIAELIGAKSADEIYFTSGASESNSWVTRDVTVLGSNIEHSSMKPKFTFDVGHDGIVDLNGECNSVKMELDAIRRLYGDIGIYHYLRPYYPTADIVSCIYVNNEIGTIQPIKHIADIAHENGALFHTDATQALAHMRINVQELGVDILSGSAHKFNGPKGVGFLYIRDGIELVRLINGGSQEQGKRGGTTNAVGVIAMAAALENSVNTIPSISSKIAYLEGRIKARLLDIEGIECNGAMSRNGHLDGILSLRIDAVRGADVVAMADEYGIMISSGSACNEGTEKPSHVLKSIGLTDEQALSSIRISVGRYNTEQEIDYVVDMLPKIIKRLRGVVTLYG